MYKYFLSVLLFLFLSLVSGCSNNPDKIEFAKTTLTDLARGDYYVEDNIDWEIFYSNNLNVGLYYSSIQDEKERADFRRNFISQFSSSFNRSGGNIDLLKDWRIKEENSSKTVVQTVTPLNRKFFITLSQRNNKLKISSLNY